MDRTPIRINVFSDGGDNKEDEDLNAAIDGKVTGNIITWIRWERLKDVLKIKEDRMFPSDRSITDSHAVSYTARGMVKLSMRHRDGRKTHSIQIYVVESEVERIESRYDVLLERSWKEKFANCLDGTRTPSAAPTILQKGKGKAEAKKWDIEAEEHAKKVLDATKGNEAQYKMYIEGNQGNGQTGSAQPT